ncbi:MAG TPA: hypothetical protein ENF64_03410, partial [Hadesarchaea archaeon]|nr:hypothetical protein [Hadesarchaea archaeon]
ALDTEANIIWGALYSEEMKNAIKVMVIISGVRSPYVLGLGTPRRKGEPIDLGLESL